MATESLVQLLPINTTRATLAMDGPASASFDTVIEAQSAYRGAAGNAITLALAADGTWVPNVGTLTLAANPGDTETCTIGSQVYTFQSTLTNVAGNVKIGTDASTTLDNLAAAINGTAGAGTAYAAATVEHAQVRAFAGAGDTLVVHTRPTILNAVGTLIATTEGMSNGGNVWGATTLADGTDGANVEFTVAGTAISCAFSSGYTCVEDFEAALAADTEASALVAVETAGTNPLYQLVVSDDDFTATSLTGSGATSSSAPSLTSKAAYRDRPFYADEALALVWSEAGSGTMDATVTLWGWEEETARGHLIGTLNEGDAIPEAADDQIRYSEMVVGVGGFSAFYAQIASPGGTATEIAVALKFCRLGERS
jgi:hypothetical protein